MLKAISLLGLILTFWGCAKSVDHQALVAAATWPDPARYETAIAAFEEEDRATPPPAGAIVAVGSSSMRGWHKTIQEDLAPYTIIPRGFGGSNMHDVLYFTDRIVTNYQPSAILLYEGDNDIADGVSPELVYSTYVTFFNQVWESNPKTKMYVLSIKPSPSRLKHWPAMQAANALLMKACKKDKRLIYVDVATPMLNESGAPRPELFLKDNLHMNRTGYEVWRDVVLAALRDGEKVRRAAK